MEISAPMEMKLARIQILVDATGRGRTVVNGIALSAVVSGFRIRSAVGEATVVSLDILADQVELETDGDVATVINWLRPEEPKPLEHDWDEEYKGPGAVCKRCRQIRRVAASVCPGPLRSAGL